MRPGVRMLLNHNKVRYEVRPVDECDVDEGYVSWLNDPDTTRYMAPRRDTATVESQRSYIRNVLYSSGDALFGLFDNRGRLVGTSGVQKLDAPDGGAWMGVLIGSKEHRGHGLGRVLIWAVASILLQRFDIGFIRADLYRSNLGSFKAFQGAGFVEMHTEGLREEICVVECTRDSIKAPIELGINDYQISAIKSG